MYTAETKVEKIKVIIADNHPVFRNGLRHLLESQRDMKVVGEAADGQEAVAAAVQYRPDVAVLDVSMPKIRGIEATRMIREQFPAMPVILISAFNEYELILSAIKAGAAAYLSKDVPPDELVNAVRVVRKGEMVFDKSTTRNIVQNLTSRAESSNQPQLHTREIEVLKLVARGLRNKEIAKELGIAERTVKAHLKNVFDKLHVESRTEAILQAIKERYIDVAELS